MINRFLISLLMFFCLQGLSISGEIKREDVINTYVSIALASYEDSLISAKALNTALKRLVENPSEESLAVAKSAWLMARVPYQQTEVFRFGNSIVDDWEGRVNAWPLDEGLIDYVDASYGASSAENNLYAVNVISNSEISINGKKVNASAITPTFLATVLHEAEGVEANVATGYHAIEFLLWGQDLNGNNPGKGGRKFSDFDTSNCKVGNCERRGEYLIAAADLLVTDLEEMVGNWRPGGEARQALVSDPAKAIGSMLMGMGSLSYGELAGERMQLGLFLNDPEEEHDCFADNTHNSHYFDQIGIANVYFGVYRKTNGDLVTGTSLADYVSEMGQKLSAEVSSAVQEATISLGILRSRAESFEAYDQMIAAGNAAGNRVVQNAIDSLVAQAQSFEKLLQPLGQREVSFEGSDSLDNPEEVFK